MNLKIRKMRTTIFKHTNVGSCKENGDLIFFQDINESCSFYILVDGMDGYSHAANAAKIIASEIYQYIINNIQKEEPCILLQNAVEIANQKLAVESKKRYCKMGATVSMILCKENTASITWLGNVRIYKIRNKKMELLTEDHILDGYPHIVTRCIKGKEFEENIPYIRTSIMHQDRFIICSDGFYNTVNMEDIIKHNPVHISFVKMKCKDSSSILDITCL